MAADPIIVEALVANNTAEDLSTLQSQILDAYVARVSVNVHLTSSSGEFGNAAGTTLASREEQRDMLACIKAAIAQIEETAADATTRPPIFSFASQRVEL